MKKVLLWVGAITLGLCVLLIEECARASARLDKQADAERAAREARGEQLAPPTPCYEAATQFAVRFSTMEEVASCLAEDALDPGSFLRCVHDLNVRSPGHGVPVQQGARFSLVKRGGRDDMFMLLQAKDGTGSGWVVRQQFNLTSCLD